MKTPLTRDEFREAVFKRDKHQCVVCQKEEGITAHHIIDRKCFGKSSGYFLDNGVTLCEDCHWLAEEGDFTCDMLRESANIKNIVLPDGFDEQGKYDKWGA